MGTFTRAGVAAAAGAALAASLGVATAGDQRPGTSVTLYRERTEVPGAGGHHAGAGMYGGYGYGGATQDKSRALVVHRHRADLAAGANDVRLPGVAARLDGATVQLESLTDPGGIVAQRQRVVRDAATPDALLERHVGRDVVVVTDAGEISGTLRSHSAAELVLETDDPQFPLRMISRGPHLRDIRFPASSAAPAAEPSLEWRLRSRQAGPHDLQVSYRTPGLSWDVDYTAVFGQGKKKADLSSWITVRNTSGMSLRGAAVTLVDQKRGQPQATGYGTTPAPLRTTWSRAFSDGIDVANGDEVQLELLAPARDVPLRGITVYEAMMDYSGYSYSQPQPQQDCYGYQYNQPMPGQAGRYLELAPPSEDSGLPAGTVRIYQRAPGGALELIAEEDVDPATAGGALRVRSGAAEGISGQRAQQACTPDSSGRQVTETVEIKVTNEGQEAEDVVVRDYMQRWSRWRIEKESAPGTNVGRAGREWRVRVPPGKDATVSYTVRYSW